MTTTAHARRSFRVGLSVLAALAAAVWGLEGCAAEVEDAEADELSADGSALTTVTFSGPSTTTQGACAGPFTVTRSSTRQRTLTLSGLGSAKAYVAPGCTGAGFSSQVLASGVQTFRFYLKDGAAENLSLRATVGSGQATHALAVQPAGGGGSDAGAGADSGAGGSDAGSSGSDAGSTVSDAGSFGTDAGSTSARVRGMWTSDSGNAVSSAARGSAARNAFFAQLSAKQINRVILEARALLKNDRAKLKDFVEDCKGRGIDVEFMVNARRDGYTILSSAAEMAPYAGYAKAYQTSYCPTGTEAACASAFNIDYEPHIFPEWDTNRAKTETDYLTGVAQIKAALAGSRLALAAAVTNWYDGSAYDTGGKNFVKAILDAGVDRYYIMNYTDTQAQMSSRVSGEVGMACAIPGKEVISISDAKDEGSTAADMALTFRQEGWAAMNAAWGYLNTQFGTTTHPCFKGNAGFDYDDMIVLPP
ncbi:MAG: hypothetical protein U0174_28470 [Polyangiaceae bacterium]